MLWKLYLLHRNIISRFNDELLTFRTKLLPKFLGIARITVNLNFHHSDFKIWVSRTNCINSNLNNKKRTKMYFISVVNLPLSRKWQGWTTINRDKISWVIEVSVNFESWFQIIYSQWLQKFMINYNVIKQNWTSPVKILFHDYDLKVKRPEIINARYDIIQRHSMFNKTVATVT